MFLLSKSYKKGAINFLLVSVLIGIILIALSSYMTIRAFEYTDVLSLENNYYKTQDIKHSVVLASKKGAEEGMIIFNIKHKLWESCVCANCIGEPTNCVIPSYYTCSICGDEPSLEKEIKQRVIEHIYSLNEYYHEDERYSIQFWCADTTQSQLSDVGWNMKASKQAVVHQNPIQDCEDYISVYTSAGGLKIKFEKKITNIIDLMNPYKIIGMSVYDSRSDIATVAFIPSTEEFDLLWIN